MARDLVLHDRFLPSVDVIEDLDHLTDTTWPDGPWNNEPDKIVWIDAPTDLDCTIVRNHMGVLCGYVGLPPNHPWHGVDYDAIDVAVHGGLTFAGTCQEHGGLCHTPRRGRPHDVWWLGFDCAHAWDFIPRLYAVMLEERDNTSYKSLPWVVNEVEHLASQCAIF